MRLAVIAALAAASLAMAAPKVSVAPGALVLGRDSEAEILVIAPGQGRLRSSANLGTLTAEGVEGDQQRFVYRAPAIKAPQMAVLLFWVEDGGRPDVAVVRVPLIGRTDLEATTEPGATVRVSVDRKLFGPVKADGKGRVVVPIEVPPGTTSATVLAESRGLSTSRAVPLGVPAGNPLAAVLSPDPLPGDGEGWLVVAHAEELDVDSVETRVEGARVERSYAGTDRALYKVFPEAGVERVSAKVTLRSDAQANAWAVAAVETLEALPTPSDSHRAPEVDAALGYFYAGGANSGPSLSAGAGYPLPGVAGRLTAEAWLGVRAWSTSAPIATGVFSSSVLAVPISAALRVRVIERGRGSLFGRVGGGVLPFRHGTRPPIGSGFSETGLSFEAFAAVQGAYDAGPVVLFAELRGTLAPVRTARLDADAGGGSFLLGARYPLP